MSIRGWTCGAVLLAVNCRPFASKQVHQIHESTTICLDIVMPGNNRYYKHDIENVHFSIPIVLVKVLLIFILIIFLSSQMIPNNH